MIELTITQFAVGIQQQASPPSQVIQITQGIPGVGLPSGGDTGEVLRKLSGVDYAFEWVTLFVSDLGDVDTTGAATDDLLTYDGTEWVATSTPSVDRVSFDTLNPATLDAAGDLAWDDLDQALAYRTNGITVDIGQENLVYVRNPSGGSTLPKNAAVAVDGASSNRLRVKLCNSVEGGDGCRTLGVTMGAIPSPGFGFVSTFGLLRGFDTGTIIGGGVAPGSELFISSTPGVLSTQPQASPGRRVTVGYVVTTGAQGSIFVTVRRGLSVNELDNVHAPSPTDGQVLRYVTATGRYELDTLTPSDVGADPAGSAAAVQGNLDSHTGATTSVHGIADTSALIVEGDARLTNSRFPTLHANTHATGGTDAISPADIGAYAASNPSGFVDAAGAAAAAPVQSVNTQTGSVVLSASDVGAYPDTNPSGFVDATGAANAAPVQSVDGLTGAVDLSGEYEALGAVDARVPDPSGEADGRILVVGSGALVYGDQTGGGGGGAVDSVNGQTGVVVLDASDIGYDDTGTGVTAATVQAGIDQALTGTDARLQRIATRTQGQVLLAWDDFRRAAPVTNLDGDLAPSGQAWVLSDPTTDVFTIPSSGYAKKTGTAQQLAFVNVSTINASVFAWAQTENTTSSKRVGLVAAAVDVNNHVRLQLDTSNNMVLTKVIGGTAANLAAITTSPKNDRDVPNLYRLEVRQLTAGGAISVTAHINGTRYGSYSITDAAEIAALGTGFGLFGANAQWQGFWVTATEALT